MIRRCRYGWNIDICLQLVVRWLRYRAFLDLCHFLGGLRVLGGLLVRTRGVIQGGNFGILLQMVLENFMFSVCSILYVLRQKGL